MRPHAGITNEPVDATLQSLTVNRMCLFVDIIGLTPAPTCHRRATGGLLPRLRAATILTPR